MNISRIKININDRKIVFIVLLTLLFNINAVHGKTSSDSWLLFARETNNIFNKCFQNITTETITPHSSWSCLKWNSLTLFDKITSTDVIPITNHIQLVRGTRNKNVNEVSEGDAVVSRIYESPTAEKNVEIDVNRTVWLNHITKRTVDVLETHDIRILFDEMMNKDIGEARRRHRMQMFPAMIFGMAVLGCIIIPLGFHVLTVIGGKALFIAKMALLIATITSLKKLTTQGGHYGLYHTDPQFPPPPYPYLDRHERSFERRDRSFDVNT